MKRVAAIWICLILLFSSISVCLGASNDIEDIQESTSGDTPLSPGPGPQPGAQLYYTTRTAFDADTGPLQFFEDFEDKSPDPPNGAFDAPLDENTNNPYFKPGDIEPGIRFWDNPVTPGGLVSIPPGPFGNPSRTVTANTFLDSWDIDFFNNDTWAVGMDIQTYIGEVTVEISIYGVGGVLLDTTTAPGTNAGTFWGVISDELITRINLEEPTGSCVESGDNIAFGEPTLTVDRIELTPDPVTVVVGENQQFTATAYDIFNNPIPGAVFIWSTNVGTVNSAGLFTAQTTPGTGMVVATSGSASASAGVTVVPGILDHVIVTPDPVSIPVGGTQQFTAIAHDVFCNVIPGVSFIWTTDIGSIDATGFFTAQSSPGVGIVTPTNGTVNGSATVTIIEIFNIDISTINSNGWILMSYPTKVSGHPFTVIVDALDDGGGYVQWDIIRGWDINNNTWMTSAKFWPPSLNSFNYVDNTMGFWLHISDHGDNNFTFAGPLAMSGELAIIPLKAGWQLIGYPFPTEQPAIGTLGSLFSLMGPVYTYDPSAPYGYRIFNVVSENQRPCGAYWVCVTFDEDLWMWCP